MGYSLLLQTQNPSWLYSVYQGATTIWERWNSYTLETGFGKVAMNSFNHYAYGSVLEWVYKYVAGIDTDANIAGYKHIVLRPMPDTRKKSELPEGQSKITWVRAKYDSVSGTIESAWSVEDGLFTYEDFKAHTTEEIYNAFPAQYFKVAIGKGKGTYEDIIWILNTFLQ